MDKTIEIEGEWGGDGVGVVKRAKLFDTKEPTLEKPLVIHSPFFLLSTRNRSKLRFNRPFDIIEN